MATDIYELSLRCEREPPFLEQFDAWGRRVDLLVTSPAWQTLHDISAEEGLIAIAYERKFAEWRYYSRTKTKNFIQTDTFKEGRKEEFFLFNDALNTFYLRLYDITHMVKDHSREIEMFYLTTHSTHFIYGYMASDMVTDHSGSKRGNPLPLHRLLFSIDSKGSFICTIPQTG